MLLKRSHPAAAAALPTLWVHYTATNMHRWERALAKMGTEMSGPQLEVAQAVRGQLKEVQGCLPLIVALRKPGMHDRHWDCISAATGCSFKADAGVHALMISASLHILCAYFIVQCSRCALSIVL
jgi:Dynein heavy chain, N-terminal region 2